MQKVIDLLAFRKVHQPETLAPRDETKDPVDDDLIFDTDDEEDDDGDDDESADLGGFVVADEEVDDGASASEAAARIKQAKPQKKLAAKKDPKNKGKDKVKSPPRTLAEVRKDAMRNAKSKKQCMCFLHLFVWGSILSPFSDKEC